MTIHWPEMQRIFEQTDKNRMVGAYRSHLILLHLMTKSSTLKTASGNNFVTFVYCVYNFLSSNLHNETNAHNGDEAKEGRSKITNR